MRHEFFDIFKFAAIPLFELYRWTINGKKYAQDKEKKEKTQKSEGFFLFFGTFFGGPKEASPNDPRAYVLAQVGAVIR